MALSQDGEVRDLSNQAQAELRAEIQPHESDLRRRSLFRVALGKAEESEAKGDFSQALAELQTALAIDSENPQVLALQESLLRRQVEAERQSQIQHWLTQAFALTETRDYDGALAKFGDAERWPGAGLRGRIDYGRAEAYLGRGDREQAERCYLRAIEADRRTSGPSPTWYCCT